MVTNYLRATFRSLKKNKFYSTINILGLAIGIATCLLILLYVLDEWSFDRYNLHADQIYRVNNEIHFGDNHVDLAAAPGMMGTTMIKECPQVEQFTRLQWHESMMIKKGTKNLREERVCVADSTLFDVFILPMLDGDSKPALRKPYSLAISNRLEGNS